MHESKILLSKKELEVELFNAYFKTLNRINILIELNSEIEDTDCKVIKDALLVLREQLELAKAHYYTNTKSVTRD